MKKSISFKGLIAMMLAVILALGTSMTAFASETDDSQNNESVTYTVAVETAEENGTIAADVTSAHPGDVVTVTATAKEGYVLTQVAYRTVAEDGTTGKTVEVSAVDGKYTFTMPESNVEVGAAFQPENSAVLYNSGTSGDKLGVVGSKDDNYSVYVANWDAYIFDGDSKTDVYLSFDERFLEIDGITMTLQSRQYNDEGYKSVGEITYTKEELTALVNEHGTKTEDGYIINTASIPNMTGKNFEEGLLVYCVVQFGCPTWVDAFGNSLYRWNYTGVDATIVADGTSVPEPIVWLYNLDEDSYRGSVVRSVLKSLDVKAGTVNNENLGQNIGYLVGWEGYNAVDNPYSSNEYDVEYMLMGNLSDAEMDLLLGAMDDENIFVALKSIPTAWTAGKTFEELFEIMAEESEVLQEAVALDKMIYTAEQLDEETYGDSEYWAELQKELAEALVALQTDAEESEEGAGLYRNARLELEAVYLLVSGKTVLEGDLELVLEDLNDGTYKVTAQLNGDLEDPTFTYNWEPAKSSVEAAADHIIVAAEDLYKVSLEIEATGRYYGAMEGTLYVPGKPSYEVATTKNSITVVLDKQEEALNTPEVLGSVVELYQNGELVASQSTTSNKVVFADLLEETEYVVKVNAYNIIGRSDIVESTVKTVDAATGTAPGDSITPDEGTTPGNGTTPDDGTTPDNGTTSGNGTTNGNATSPNTGDVAANYAWMILVMVLCAAGGVLLVKQRAAVK